MRDWKAIAQAHGLNLPADKLERITAPLAALEATFRPLMKDLAPGLEPATGLQPDEEGQ